MNLQIAPVKVSLTAVKFKKKRGGGNHFKNKKKIFANETTEKNPNNLNLTFLIKPLRHIYNPTF